MLTTSLTTPDLGPRRGVVSRNRPVDVDQNTRIRGVISSRKRNEGCWVSVSSTGDGDLPTGKIELRATFSAGAVERNVLDAEEIVAIR
jgi:hypothetical protein